MDKLSIYKKPLYEARKITDLKDMIHSSCEIYADTAAFLVKKEGAYSPITYKQYMEDINALGTKLTDMGLKGARIAVVGEASYRWAVTYLAVLCGVGVIVPLDKELPQEEMENLIDIADVKMIIYSPKVKTITDDINVQYKIPMDEAFDKLVEEGRELLAQMGAPFARN